MRSRDLLATTLLAALMGALAGCGTSLDLDRGVPAPAGARPPPECSATSYDFAGRGTLAGLGLVGHSAAELPEPNRPAMIWVTHEEMDFDVGPPGGPFERARMLCFEFDDGSGGTDWPVDDAWQPPRGEDQRESVTSGAWVWIGLAAVVLGGISLLIFRRRA